MKKKTLQKIVKFGIVGSIGFLIDFGVTWLFFSVLGLNEYLSNALGFMVAATNNYTLNRLWTWRSSNSNIRSEYFKFLLVSSTGLVLNSFIVWLTLHYTGDVSYLIWGYSLQSFWLAKLLATFLVMIWNFVVNNLFTFRSSK